MGRIGFCCKWLDTDGKPHPTLNQKSTTVTAFKKLSPKEKQKKVDSLVEYNITTLLLQLAEVTKLNPSNRVFRITSDMLPLYTHPSANACYKQPHIAQQLYRLHEVNRICRKNKIRIGFHPGQYTNLCSPNADTVINAVADLQYHAMLGTFMHMGSVSEFTINIHANLNQDPTLDRFRRVYDTLPMHLRYALTLENDEFTSSLAQLTKYSPCPVVMDIHHHWIKSEGEWLHPDSKLVAKVIKSWDGHTPLMHVSQCKEDLCKNKMPDWKKLQHYGKTNLRAHSDKISSPNLRKLTKKFAETFDIELECKAKNLALF